jgi:hypothetical protein
MLKLNAIFHRKEDNLNPRSCVVEKVIPLSGAAFDSFSANMLRDQEFIADNAELMHVDRDGVYHCLLVTGEGRDDGILIQSEGVTYARYASHVPHVHSVIAAQNQSPALAALGEKLSALADYLADSYLTLLDVSDRAVLYLSGQARDFDIDISYSEVLRNTIIDMVGERLEGHDLDMEFENDDLIVTSREQDMQMGM